MKNNFDAILTSAPLNSTAAKVTARGEHWEPESQMPPGFRHWKAPPIMRRFSAAMARTAAVDLTGKKFGRFTVLGMWEEDSTRWILRCVCGDYEARSAKTIKAALAGLAPPDSISFQCWYCHSWHITKNRQKKKGSKSLSAFVGAKPRVVEASKPETIISDRVARHVEREDGCYQIAIDIIADLNRKGYRITRAPAGSDNTFSVAHQAEQRLGDHQL